MDDSGTDADVPLLRWRQGRLDKRALHVAVRGPMCQAARSGISSITSSDPDPQDIEDAVYDAFVQLWAKDPADVSSVTGLAKVIARRRGQDIGWRVVREREQIEELLANPLAMAAVEFNDEDVRAAASPGTQIGPRRFPHATPGASTARTRREQRRARSSGSASGDQGPMVRAWPGRRPLLALPDAAHAPGWPSFARIHGYGSRSGARLALRRS